MTARTTLASCNHLTEGPVAPVFKLREAVTALGFGLKDRLVIDIVTESGKKLATDLVFVVTKDETEFTLYFNGEGKLYRWWLIGASGLYYPEEGEGATKGLS